MRLFEDDRTSAPDCAVCASKMPFPDPADDYGMLDYVFVRCTEHPPGSPITRECRRCTVRGIFVCRSHGRYRHPDSLLA